MEKTLSCTLHVNFSFIDVFVWVVICLCVNGVACVWKAICECECLKTRRENRKLKKKIDQLLDEQIQNTFRHICIQGIKIYVHPLRKIKLFIRTLDLFGYSIFFSFHINSNSIHRLSISLTLDEKFVKNFRFVSSVIIM